MYDTNFQSLQALKHKRMIDGLQYLCHSLMFLHTSIRLYRSLKELACQLFAQDDTRREYGPLD